MKQISFFLFLNFLSVSAALSQHSGLQNFIDSHKNEPSFTYAFLSKDLFELVSNTQVEDKNWQGLHNVVKNIGSLRVLAASNIETGLALYKEARTLVPEQEFDELLAVRDGNENVRIWIKSEESVVTDLVLLVGAPDEFALICFAGSLELGNLSALADLFDNGRASQLAKSAEAAALDFSLSPNPSSGTVILTVQEQTDVPVALNVYDQHGRMVLAQNLSGLSIQTVDLGQLGSGMYWVQVKSSQGEIGVKQLQLLKN